MIYDYICFYLAAKACVSALGMKRRAHPQTLCCQANAAPGKSCKLSAKLSSIARPPPPWVRVGVVVAYGLCIIGCIGSAWVVCRMHQYGGSKWGVYGNMMEYEVVGKGRYGTIVTR
jgi:hypothetical protein